MSIVDLHTHSTASDGLLDPRALVERAAARGVTLLALTDHDTTDGLDAARAAASGAGIAFVPGTELSALWGGLTVHVLGLDIGPESLVLRAHIEGLGLLRAERAEAIGRGLAKAGIPDATAHAARLAGGGMLTRTHFARVIVETGRAATVKAVFDRYLRHGLPGHVAASWPSLAETVAVIRASGGVAVLAHPLRYGLTGTKLRALAEDFRQAGGTGIEVVYSRNTAEQTRTAAALARRAGLAASTGSDFHGAGLGYCALGGQGVLPEDLRPVWECFAAC